MTTSYSIEDFARDALALVDEYDRAAGSISAYDTLDALIGNAERLRKERPA